jgi:hypothetical protein
VYFEGTWTSVEQRRISTAVAEYEETSDGRGLLSGQPTWVCVAYDVGASTLFCAHRPRLPGVLSAQSVTDLAQEIRSAS